MRRLLTMAVLPLILACSPAEPRRDDDTLTRSRYLMGTPLTITVPAGHQEAVEAAFDEVARIEALISTWRDDSVFAEINEADVDEAIDVDPWIAGVLNETIEWSARTGGAFDPAAGRILLGWDLRGEGRVPSDEEIESYLSESGSEHLVVDSPESTVTKRSDLLIEEGGFGKGLALDRAAETLRSAGVERALLDFGGQVTVWGETPTTIGIAHPEDRMLPAVELALREGSVATSSGSERFFERDGERYSHLLDPRSGRALPPRGSVTVVHESGFVADILATALYVMGPDDGIEWADRNQIKAVFNVPATDGGWNVRMTDQARRSLELRTIDSKFTIERKRDDS